MKYYKKASNKKTFRKIRAIKKRAGIKHAVKRYSVQKDAQTFFMANLFHER